MICKQGSLNPGSTSPRGHLRVPFTVSFGKPLVLRIGSGRYSSCNRIFCLPLTCCHGLNGNTGQRRGRAARLHSVTTCSALQLDVLTSPRPSIFVFSAHPLQSVYTVDVLVVSWNVQFLGKDGFFKRARVHVAGSEDTVVGGDLKEVDSLM